MTQKQIIVSMLVNGELLTPETFIKKTLNSSAKLSAKINELQTEGIRVRKKLVLNEKNNKMETTYELSKSKTSQEALNKYIHKSNP